MSIPDINEQRTPLCRVTAGEQLDAAWDWLCDSRKDAPANADIWHLRHHWHRARDNLLTRLLNGEYRLQPMLLTKKRPHHDRQVMWGSQDALVLKWTALLITPHLDLHPRCEHVKGHGGGPQSVHRMHDALTTHNYAWVCRTDVKGYYRHINKARMMDQVKQYITDPVLQGLIRQYLHYTVEDGGEFHTPESGIARGCALSPLMGALHLYAMDAWFGQRMEQAKKNGTLGIYYARYMDDVVILAHTRWQLRKQVRALNQFFNEAGFCQHPDKTFIGRTARGYDWMGAQMSDVGVEGIAHRARANHLERLRRLYEQVRRWPAARRRARMSQYRTKWSIWALSIAGGALAAPCAAQIGTPDDLQRGFSLCVKDGRLSNLPFGRWGGTCTIHLSAENYTDSHSVSGNLNPPASPNHVGLTLVSENRDTPLQKDSFHLQLSSDLRINTWCGQQIASAFVYQSGLTIGTGSLAVGENNVPSGLSCDNASGNRVAPVDGAPVGSAHAGSIHYDGAVGGDLTWTLDAQPGAHIAFPKLNLVVTNAVYGGAYFMTIGIGGNAGIDPTPYPVPIAGEAPNCTAITGVSATVYDFGSTNGRAGIGPLQSSRTVSAHPLSLSCSAGSNGSIGANATLYVQSSNALSADKLSLLSASNDWLGMALKMPTSLPSSARLASGQNLNTPVVWNGSSPTPLWTWQIPSHSSQGTITVPTVSLQPQVIQLQAAPGTMEGLRTYTVTYSTVIQ